MIRLSGDEKISVVMRMISKNMRLSGDERWKMDIITE